MVLLAGEGGPQFLAQIFLALTQDGLHAFCAQGMLKFLNQILQKDYDKEFQQRRRIKELQCLKGRCVIISDQLLVSQLGFTCIEKIKLRLCLPSLGDLILFQIMNLLFKLAMGKSSSKNSREVQYLLMTLFFRKGGTMFPSQ